TEQDSCSLDADTKLALTVCHGVTVPPVLSVPRLEYTAVLGQPLSLVCSADGQPKPEIQWHRERRPLVAGTHLHLFFNGTLHVPSTQRSDAGTYTCSAQNVAGGASHDIRVLIHGELLSHAAFCLRLVNSYRNTFIPIIPMLCISEPLGDTLLCCFAVW
uniref:Ig-like domain-containing protein n=1 Tax=Electrophorus electricus TaxID=8005 RepID=A0AAY5F4U8_ELEEL